MIQPHPFDLAAPLGLRGVRPRRSLKIRFLANAPGRAAGVRAVYFSPTAQELALALARELGRERRELIATADGRGGLIVGPRRGAPMALIEGDVSVFDLNAALWSPPHS